MKVVRGLDGRSLKVKVTQAGAKVKEKSVLYVEGDKYYVRIDGAFAEVVNPAKIMDYTEEVEI